MCLCIHFPYHAHSQNIFHVIFLVQNVIKLTSTLSGCFNWNILSMSVKALISIRRSLFLKSWNMRCRRSKCSETPLVLANYLWNNKFQTVRYFPSIQFQFVERAMLVSWNTKSDVKVIKFLETDKIMYRQERGSSPRHKLFRIAN